MSVTAVILANGKGTRARTDIPKQLVKLAGIPVVQHTINTFDTHPGIDRIIVVGPPAVEQTITATKPLTVVRGGITRNDSTRAALDHVVTERVLIHDAVRPLVTHRLITRVINALDHWPAVDVVAPSTDTLVERENGKATGFPDRTRIWRGQTPQGFITASLRAAYYEQWPTSYSDDCQVMHAAGYDIGVVDGDPDNIKITHPGDFHIADRLFQLRRTPTNREPFTGRVVIVGGTSGIGAEVTRLTNGTPLGTTTGFHVEHPDETAFHNADAIIVTAGILDTAPLIDQTPTAITAMIQTNLLGTINIAKAAHKHLAATRGHLVLTTSSAYTRGRAGLAVYSATKAGIVALTQALADEWANDHIRVNCVCPERTNTPMRRKAFGPEPTNTLMTATDAAQQIVDMLGTPLTGQIFDIRRKGQP